MDHYVEVARALDQDAILRCRKTLRERLQTSALMDEERFARGFEATLRDMWARRCAGAI